MKFKLGELFCGPGGLSLGASQAKVFNQTGEEFYITHGWASDYDSDSCTTFKNNLLTSGDGKVFCDDVKNLDIENLGQIDAFAYGFPCNDYSLVGEQKGIKGKFGGLYSFGVKVLNKYSPKFFVAENVSGLSSTNKGIAFKKILSDLEKAGENGYELVVHKYRSEHYNIPQTRHRIVIVGIDKKSNVRFKVPAPTSEFNYVTSKQALEHPPIQKNAQNNEKTKQSKIVVERLKCIKPGENVFNANLPENLKLKVKGAKISQIYKRLDPNKPSYTITGSGGGGTHGYHYDEPRALTNRERARIQTFPDDYVFYGGKESVRKQIGMAVPPLLSKVIFEAILKSFAGIEYKSVKPNIQ